MRLRLPTLTSSDRTIGWADVVVGSVAILVVALPVLARDHAFFGDWGTHLFLVDQQTRVVRHSVLPTFFLHAQEVGILYPHYLFYGGTLYTITAWLGSVLGSVTAYRLTFLLGFASTYFGVLWLVRQARVKGLIAHVPSMVAISGAYYLSKVYNDGGWPEFVALSVIPLIAAAALSILTSERVPIASAVLFVVGVTVLTGSHTITLAYGSLFLLVVASVLCAVFWDRVRRIGARRAGLVGLLTVAAAGVNGWFLVPLFRYQSMTLIGSFDREKLFDAFDGVAAPFSSWKVIFNPLREYPILPGRGVIPLYVQLPVYALAWVALAGAAFVIRRKNRHAARLFLWLFALLVGLLVLILWQSLWDVLPSIVKIIQFRFRLTSYATFCIVGLLVVALVGVQSARRASWWRATAVFAAMAALALGGWQAWTARTYLPLGAVTADGTRLPPIDYAGCTAPCPNVFQDYRIQGRYSAPTDATVSSDVEAARDGSPTVRVPRAGTITTSAMLSPLLEVGRHAEILGSNGVGQAVIRVQSDARTGRTPERVRFRATATPAVWTGRIVTIVSAVVLVALLLVALWRRRRTER